MMRVWGAAAMLFFLALAVRLLPARYVWLPDRVLFFGHDAYYHMRRIVYSLGRFPETLDFDLYINFPEGARPIWTPLFDLSVAAIVLPFQDVLGPRGVEVFASLVPPLLGALNVVVLFFVLRRRFGEGVAALAGVVLALLPAHAWYSQLGFLDHHCAVALVTTCLLGAGLRQLEVEDPGAAHGRGALDALPAPLWLGLAMGVSLLIWPGTLLHVGIVQTVLAAAVLLEPDAARAVRGARRLALAQLVALALVAPSGLTSHWPQWSAASPVVLSRFQPWLFAAGALGLWGSSWIWQRWPEWGRPRPRRLLSALAVAVTLIAGSALAWPALATGAVESWQWLTRSDAFQALVAESRPLLLDAEDRFSLVPGYYNLSYFLFATPFVVGLGVWRASSGRRPAVIGLLLAWSAVLLLCALLQRRFANTASLGIAILLALSAREVLRATRARTQSVARRRAAGVLVGAAVLGCLAPALLPLGIEAGSALAGPSRVLLTGQRYEWLALYDTARWLRRHTPRTSGWLDPGEQPEYGIVGPWDVGHVVQYVGRRPTSTNNFGDDIGVRNFLLVQSYFSGDEVAGIPILEQLGARYVVVPHYPDFLAEPPGPPSMYRALYARDGSEGAGQPALQRHRLVFEHSRTASGRAERPPFKVYEFVAGARVTGAAPPGAVVRARIEVFAPGARRFEYATRSVADARGRYGLVLPYASGSEIAAVKTGREYTLGCEDTTAVLQVAESDVRRGARLRGPALCGAGGK